MEIKFTSTIRRCTTNVFFLKCLLAITQLLHVTCNTFKSKWVLRSQRGKQMKNSRRPGFFFVICIQEVKKLVLSTFTLIAELAERSLQSVAP